VRKTTARAAYELGYYEGLRRLVGLNPTQEQAVTVLRSYLARSNACRACGRKLEDPESVQRGYGPDCFSKLDPRDFLSVEEVADELADAGAADDVMDRQPRERAVRCQAHGCRSETWNPSAICDRHSVAA
jgi:hypothetical protein